MADVHSDLIELYALGLLEDEERAGVEAHLGEACAACREELARCHELMAALPEAEGAAHPDRSLREHVLEMAQAPRGPIDVGAYVWDEIMPGVRVKVLTEDPERGIRTVLVWARAGARYPQHRHLGDEEILVLQGRLRDHRGVYGPGQVCRSRTGSVHSEEAMPDEDCVCFVVYHGEHEAVPE